MHRNHCNLSLLCLLYCCPTLHTHTRSLYSLSIVQKDNCREWARYSILLDYLAAPHLFLSSTFFSFWKSYRFEIKYRLDKKIDPCSLLSFIDPLNLVPNGSTFMYDNVWPWAQGSDFRWLLGILQVIFSVTAKHPDKAADQFITNNNTCMQQYFGGILFYVCDMEGELNESWLIVADDST